jgi:prophage regulatory protein
MSPLANSAVFEAIELPADIARQRVLDERTAAKFIGVSPMTLERLRKTGAAPRHLRLTERRLGYRLADILDWLDARAAAGLED